MQLALVRQRYNAYGGAERFIERAIDALATQGVAVTLLAREWVGDPRSVIRCDPFYVGRLWRDWSFARAVCGELARRTFDLVQSHERIACCDVYRAGDGVHAQWLDNRRAALGALGRLGLALNPYHRYVLAAERRLFGSPRLRAVICNSRMVKSEIQARFGLAEGKLHVIYNGVDLQAFHPGLRDAHRAAARAELGIPDDAMTYVFVGSGFARKGVFRLLPAFRRGAAPGSHLIVVGVDKTGARAKALAGDLGIGARVHLLGGREDVRPWYGAADAFVLPTLYDPFPNAALEAMACGLPAIVTRQCGAAELVKEGSNGMVCDALDEEALARALGSLNSARARGMGVRARETAAQFGLDAMARQLIALYGNLVAEPGAIIRRFPERSPGDTGLP
jgi:UDP-glucose:(heptosyl)LPS alpha-1,3-glucosyltransferase